VQVFGKSIGFDAVEEARHAEAVGYDGLRVVDHFFSGIPPQPPVALPHSFVTLAAAAVATERVWLTQTMIAASFRHPFEVGQAVATLDRISVGRAELGIGTGWLAVEHDSMGLSLGSPSLRIERAMEAAAICREMFANRGCVDFDGDIFRAHSTAEWPETPHIPQIMVGAHGPLMLRKAAEVADRIDLLEALSGGKPDFSETHVNDAANLSSRIALATAVAHELGRELTFSATVNLQICATAQSCSAARTDLAAAAGADVAVFDREMLRVIEIEERALDRFASLSALGIDRVHVRPMDDHTARWLEHALPHIQQIA
jgi:alkanesulfonate monooxygenase SsuD/methylene tetrahydromethanopterin reductase-like flavin-dependent oxidoreductase (luciferase family)